MNKTPLDYAKQGADTLLRKFSVDTLPPAGRFHYHQGVFLSGVQRTYKLSNAPKYGDYIKEWLDFHIDENGRIPSCHDDQFDDMQPAIMLFDLYQRSPEARYKTVLDHFADVVDRWPKNARGGFWHKFFRQNQMWLDTLYMIGPFMAMYADMFEKPYFYEVAYQTMNLMRENMTDPKTGLLYHAWDDSKAVDWANPVTGTSSEFWGRAIGWYAVAIMDILDYIPEGHPRREAFISAERDILNALIRYQDKETGLWYQLVNRVGQKGNWLENSCSCLYTYALAKAIEKGVLDTSYAPYMQRGYQGVINTLTFEGEDLILSNVCIGTGVGDMQFYFDRPTVANDLHGMGAFLLMCTQVQSTTDKLALQL
jgi:Predicted unsaturated glucuronyl hydrolase involved in regulation of bacterial surface properties, and related proteins